MNAALAALYQGVILEHSCSPRNQGPLADATNEARVDNPLCGDRVVVRLRLAGERIEAARFEGQGCAIAIASASMLTALVEGRSVAEAQGVAVELERLLGDPTAHAGADRSRLGDLVALEGTRAFPTRIRCATLPWEALRRALRGGS
jgi:nitrogen fixation NifU-like protein